MFSQTVFGGEPKKTVERHSSTLSDVVLIYRHLEMLASAIDDPAQLYRKCWSGKHSSFLNR